jgi:phage gp29-like protein
MDQLAPVDRPKAPVAPNATHFVTTTKKKARRRIANEIIAADPAFVVGIFDEAETGNVRRLINAEKDTRLLDSRLDGVCAARTGAIQNRPVVFKPPPGFESDAEAKVIAERVSRLWNSTPRTVPTLGHLAHGVLEPHAICELVWTTDVATGWWKAIPQFVHPNQVGWNDAAKLALVTDEIRWPGVELREEDRDRYIFHAPVGGRSDYPWRRGAMRARLIPSLLKRLGARGWIAMLERWGQPQIIAKVDDENDPDLADRVLDALRDIGIDWRGKFPKGVDIESIDVGVSESLHRNFIDWANTEDAIAILGQNTSTEVSSGSFAAAMAQSKVRYDILATDCIELAETLTDQWVEPTVRYNWPGAPVPYAEFVLTPKRELTVMEYQAGLVDRDAWAQSNGHEPEADGKGRRYYPVPVLAGSQPTGQPAPSRPSDSGSTQPDAPIGAVPLPKPETVVEEAAATGDVAGLGLNGAQIKELKQLVIDVSQGVLPRESALGIIAVAFPTVTPAQAAAMLPAPSFTPAPAPSTGGP